MAYCRRLTPERIVELARGIVTRDYLIADGSRDWLHSLMLLGPSLARYTNLGLVLVPVGPHMGGLWLNGRVPGVTIECVPVAKRDVPALQRHVDAMESALYPDG